MFITAVPITKLFAWLCVTVYYCSTYYKAVREGLGLKTFVVTTRNTVRDYLTAK